MSSPRDSVRWIRLPQHPSAPIWMGMAFNNASQAGAPATTPSYPVASPNGGVHGSPSGPAMPTFLNERPDFDIFAWHTAYQSCLKFFLDRSQHDMMVQAVAALINIRLPFQWAENPVLGSSRYSPTGVTAPGSYASAYGRHGMGAQTHNPGASWVSLTPYIRRLVATGFDTDGILHGFFGDDWRRGVGDLQEVERRNFLFTAKSVGWAKVKYQYDMPPHEMVPFIRPLQNVRIEEIESAEKEWSKWLAMEDWMVGPRDPDVAMAANPRDDPV